MNDSSLATTLYLRDADGQLEGELTTALTPAWYVSDALGSILGSTVTADSKPKLVNVTPYSDYGVKLGKSYTRMGFGGEIADPNFHGSGVGTVAAGDTVVGIAATGNGYMLATADGNVHIFN